MCFFFSAVVTPQGIFFSEDWSHVIVRGRLGDPEDAVDVEYDRERGLKVHEPLQLQEWFDTAAVVLRVVELYGQLGPIEKAFKGQLDEIEWAYWKQLDELEEAFKEQYNQVYRAYKEQLDQAKKAHMAKLASFKGYVPPPGEKYTEEELDRNHEEEDDDGQP